MLWYLKILVSPRAQSSQITKHHQFEAIYFVIQINWKQVSTQSIPTSFSKKLTFFISTVFFQQEKTIFEATLITYHR